MHTGLLYLLGQEPSIDESILRSHDLVGQSVS